MAFERSSDSKVKGDSLDAFVTNLSNTFKNQVAIRNAEDESRFNTAVLEQNLSLDDQLAYRKEQLKNISDDPTERARIKGEISALKDRIEQKKFSDAYTQKLIDHEAGITSIDSVIGFLNEQKAATTDQTIINEINKALIAKSAEKFKATSDLLENSSKYAINDKTESIINNQIATVSSAKNRALLAGDQLTASTLDLQLQALTKAKSENAIEKDIKNFAVSSITGYATATKLLDAYNAKIASSLSSGPVTIGDVTYSSAQEFWTNKRDTYVADSSSSGFFGRLSDEIDSKIKLAESKGGLAPDTVSASVKDVTNLAGRPELAGYESKIDLVKQNALQTGANLIANSIYDRYTTDYDINKAVASLNEVKALGVNVDSTYSKLLVAGASVKQGAINNILSAAQVALQNNPGMTPEQALNQAIASGAGSVLSPKDLTGASEKKIAGDMAAGATNQTYTSDPRLTIDNTQTTTPGAQPTTPAGQQQPAVPGATTAASSGTKTITVKPGETLSSIAARELGSASKFNEIAALNNIQDPNKIQSGAVLKIPGEPTPAAQPTVTTAQGSSTPNPQPTPSPVAQPQQQPTVQPAQPKVTPVATPSVAPKVEPVGPSKPTYNGSSIVDYLGSVGKDASFAARSNLAAQNGISNYKGDAQQNLTLLKKLRGF